MANQPRKHHFVPKFYLAGFTKCGKEGDELFVTDKRQRRKWVSTPAKTARETDFYRIEGENVDPMEIEKAFAKMEGQCASVLREIIESSRLPTDDGFGVLMNFVAYASSRVPSMRSTIAKRIDQALKQHMRRDLLGPKGAMLLRELGESGTDQEIEELQAFIASNDYSVSLEQNWHIGSMVAAVNELLPVLARRNWALWTVGDDVPDLVCSDRPVAFFRIEREPGEYPMRFDSPNTLLTIPLNRRMALVSAFEQVQDFAVMDHVTVAFMNSIRARYANQIYSSEEKWLMGGRPPNLRSLEPTAEC